MAPLLEKAQALLFEPCPDEPAATVSEGRAPPVPDETPRAEAPEVEVPPGDETPDWVGPPLDFEPEDCEPEDCEPEPEVSPENSWLATSAAFEAAFLARSNVSDAML